MSPGGVSSPKERSDAAGPAPGLLLGTGCRKQIAAPQSCRIPPLPSPKEAPWLLPLWPGWGSLLPPGNSDGKATRRSRISFAFWHPPRSPKGASSRGLIGRRYWVWRNFPRGAGGNFQDDWERIVNPSSRTKPQRKAAPAAGGDAVAVLGGAHSGLSEFQSFARSFACAALRNSCRRNFQGKQIPARVGVTGVGSKGCPGQGLIPPSLLSSLHCQLTSPAGAQRSLMAPHRPLPKQFTESLARGFGKDPHVTLVQSLTPGPLWHQALPAACQALKHC